MSFGYSAGDFIAIGQLTWTVYKSCKGAPGEFQELARELSSLHTILHELEHEAKTPSSLLNRRGTGRKPELEALLENLSTTVNKVDDIVKRYHSLGRDQKKTWDRVKFATKDLADLRSKLQLHITGINLFISSLSAGSLARIEGLLDELVKDIREGRKEPTIVSTYEDNDELAWNELERELVGDGITREDVRCYREEIRDYLRRLVEDDADTLHPFDSVSWNGDPGHSTFNRDYRVSQEVSPSNPNEEPAAWHLNIIANEDLDHGPSVPGETLLRGKPLPDPNDSPEILDRESMRRITISEMARRKVTKIETVNEEMTGKIMARLADPSIDLSDLDFVELQTIVFIATMPEERLGDLGIRYSSLAKVNRARGLTRELAFRKESFDYDSFGRLGSANHNSIDSHDTLSSVKYLNLASFGSTAFKIYKRDLPSIPSKIEHALKVADLEYIEIPEGYRVRNPDFAGDIEVFILIRKVQLLGFYTILFCNSTRDPLHSWDAKKTMYSWDAKKNRIIAEMKQQMKEQY